MSDFNVEQEKLDKFIAKYTKLNEVVDKLSLTEIHNMKPLLDGTAICKLYDVKPGKYMRGLMEEEI